MKEQLPTSNIEHRTPNTERWSASGRPERFQARRSPSKQPKVFDLEDRLLEFASTIIDICENLPDRRAGNHVAGQLLRSGTSPYSNHGEAESAESPDDFIHKLKICLKELRETRRWLRLVYQKKWLGSNKHLEFALGEVVELIRIFVASIRTAERNRSRASARPTSQGRM